MPSSPLVTLDLRGTRSSRAWSSRPGNWDPLNLRTVFPSDNELGIPALRGTGQIPTNLVNYNAKNRLAQSQSGDCVHFFLDDYRFETMWTQPERSVSRVARVGMALTPDFSLYPEMPEIVQMWNVYRSRWCGAWMTDHGINVIPTVGWSDRRSWRHAFLGLPRGTTVAVSTVGIIRAGMTEQRSFLDGYDAMVDYVKPALVVIYGKPLPGIPDSVEHVYHDPRRWS